MGCRDIHDATQIGMLMGYCDHQMHRLMTRMLRQYDVSPMQCRTLTFLKGLVRRQTSRSDGRCRILALTDAGRQFYAQFCAIADQVNARAGQGFSPEERDTLRRLLLRIADNLSETQEDTE